MVVAVTAKAVVVTAMEFYSGCDAFSHVVFGSELIAPPIFRKLAVASATPYWWIIEVELYC